MRRFLVPELSSATYQGTLFSNLKITDERHPTVVQRDPIPPLSRVIALGGAEELVHDGPRCLDGSLDLRYTPTVLGKRDSWVEFSRLLDWLEKAKAQGDMCERKHASSFPVMVIDWHRDGEATDAAVLTAIEGWAARPIYFKGEFEVFTAAVDRLIDLRSEILSGTAASEMDDQPSFGE
jgi:hypothetical protein